MKFENFELLDNELIDNSILKRDFHQQGANLNNPHQNNEVIFDENNNYHQIGNACLQLDITVRQIDVTNFNITDNPVTSEVNRLVNNGFSNCFKEGRLGTTGRSDLEHSKFVGIISTIMRVLVSKD